MYPSKIPPLGARGTDEIEIQKSKLNTVSKRFK